jgi:hypothetical protein
MDWFRRREKLFRCLSAIYALLLLLAALFIGINHLSNLWASLMAATAAIDFGFACVGFRMPKRFGWPFGIGFVLLNLVQAPLLPTVGLIALFPYRGGVPQ